MNYCYNPHTVMQMMRRPGSYETDLECTEDDPCDLCQGDCDDDVDCTDPSCAEFDTDFYGNDVGQDQPVESWQECAQLCEGKSYCHAFSYITTNFSNSSQHKACYYKSTDYAAGKSSTPGIISGTKSCIAANTRRCFLRNKGETAPGCDQGEKKLQPRVDVCYDPESAPAKGHNVGNCDTYPCKACQGTCSSDLHCEGELTCQERSSGELVDGCNIDAFGPTDNICAPFPAAKELRHLGFSACTNTASGKCDACRGDCDIDDDCKDGLECFQRGSANKDDPIPGCDMNHSVPDQTDFCYQP